MPKRKKTDDDRGDDRKRSRILDLPEMLQSLYSALQNCKAEDGHLLCENFIRTPKKRSQADYYEVVTNPMDMLRINQKLKAEEYTDLEQMTSDVALLVSNAKTYYKEDTQAHRDACELWQGFESAKAALLAANAKAEEQDDEDMEKEPQTPTAGQAESSEEDHYEELFTSVMTATDAEGRCISSMFQLLPSRSLYPEYYKIITDPVDLKIIATRIQEGTYTSLAELERDLMLLVKNARTFNEPGSLIYKDATAMKKAIRMKKAEIDQRKNAPGKCSERIRSRRLLSHQKLSAITAALKYEDADPLVGKPEVVPPAAEGDAVVAAAPVAAASSAAEESDNDSNTEDPVNSPMWQLLEGVRNYQCQGYFLAEPFVKLPSKKLYPDYYREIKQPISLNKIAGKIKSEGYTSMVEVVDDFNLLFENAKKYNRPDSKIFKDATRLQKIMQAKARELINIHMKESDSDGGDADSEKARRKSKKVATPPCTTPLKGRPPGSTESTLKKRLKVLVRTLLNYTDEVGRPLISIFMEKPSRKDYPDYYEVITNPIDMKTIHENVKNNKYSSEDAMVSDLKLMFSNCRMYNEEGSQIYRDADTLERALFDKIRELGSLYESPAARALPRPRRNKSRNHKLRVLYDTIKDYTDAKGRKLSIIFMKLPSRSEYPDYYEVIKKPIDMERIAARLLKYNQYESMDDLLADFVLLFDNACKYNEPDSQIYKDALILQRIALQTKMELSSEELEDGGVPDVRGLVQELLTNLFISVYNHQDEEGRCYSDSLVELSESAAESGQQVGIDGSEDRRILTLDLIKRKLDRGCYLRLDRFQEDVFDVFDRARRTSRTDSQAFEDSVELQSYFIRLRDELCGQGDILQSPALNYNQQELMESVDLLRAQKLPQEQQEAAAEADAERKSQEGRKEEEKSNEMSSSDSTEHKGIVIHVGDFVYIEPSEKGMQPHITNVDRLWRDKSGEQWLYGCWFYRPNETFHLASRKFLQKEVFKSDNYNSIPVNQVLGKCYVMPVKDYFKSKPEGFDDKDVYVCESRYSAKAKAFKKIKAFNRVPHNHLNVKIWNFVPNEHTKLVPREEVLSAVRVPSVFKDGVDRSADNSSNSMCFALEEEFKVVDRPRPNVTMSAPNEEENVTYYEQLNLPSGVFKLGDCCYVRTEHSKTLIGRIDKMWMDREGNGFFHGPWFVLPSEIQHPPSRVFYRQEVFLSSIEDTNPLLSIIGRCSVLDCKEYTTCRLTEINETDVYICESRYLEAERQIRKLPKGLKKFSHSEAATPDEVYYFKNPITPQKCDAGLADGADMQPTGDEMSPMPSRVMSETDNEESNDVPCSALARDDSNLSSASGKKKSTKRVVTGYLLFSSEIRKSIVQSNPDRSFGDISRLVGNEWRNLQAPQKADYEERASRLNLSQEDTNDSLPQSPASSSAHAGGGVAGGGESSRDATRSLSSTGSMTPAPGDFATLSTTVYECQWDGCDASYDNQQDLVDHLAQDPNGQVYQSYLGFKDNNEFQCLWANCPRVKKQVPPFPNIQKLLRHVREVHVKVAGRIVMPEAKNRNMMLSRKNLGSPATAAGVPYSTPPPVASPAPMAAAPHHAPPPHHHYGSSPMHPMMAQQGYPGPFTPPHHYYMPLQPHPSQAPGLPPPPPERTLEPIFVAPPPHPHKLLHTYAYIRYIENLQPDSKHVTNWDAQLKATKENTPIYDTSRLPTHWLGNGVGSHGNAVNALWALRDFMLRDALGVARIS
ncbi:protein polybromo-1-like isoform X3 [Dermacentor silvarum]|uniref:protein polybromo-1-like isoform X3 n=1 Tax=Dermacentor silvarum TaxID=543639 RepID=UPI001897CAB4|nr:protein polybromo-1-like isoform X3 [Dermacentor silvarum]